MNLVRRCAAIIAICFLFLNYCVVKNKCGGCSIYLLLKIGSQLFYKYQNAGCRCKIYWYARINMHTHILTLCHCCGVHAWRNLEAARSHIITRLMSHPLWLNTRRLSTKLYIINSLGPSLALALRLYVLCARRDIIFRMAIMCYCAQTHTGRRHARIRWPVPPFFPFLAEICDAIMLSDIPCTQTHTGVAFSPLYWEKYKILCVSTCTQINALLFCVSPSRN